MRMHIQAMPSQAMPSQAIKRCRRTHARMFFYSWAASTPPKLHHDAGAEPSQACLRRHSSRPDLQTKRPAACDTETIGGVATSLPGLVRS